MRNPRRSRNLTLLIFAAGLAAFAIALQMPDAGTGFTLQTVLAIGGLTVAGLSFMAGLNRVFDTRSYDRMMRGEGIIARWTVDADTWKAFVALNQRLQRERSTMNIVAVYDHDPPTRSVEVIVSEDAICVDGDFHSVPRGGVIRTGGPCLLSGPPACLEFQLSVLRQGSSGPLITGWILRFPVAPGAEEQAQRVIQHFGPRPLLIQNFELARNISLIVAVLCGVSFATGLLLRDWVEQQTILLAMVVIGAIGGLGSLYLVLFWHLRLRHNPRS